MTGDAVFVSIILLALAGFAGWGACRFFQEREEERIRRSRERNDDRLELERIYKEIHSLETAMDLLDQRVTAVIQAIKDAGGHAA